MNLVRNILVRRFPNRKRELKILFTIFYRLKCTEEDEVRFLKFMENCPSGEKEGSEFWSKFMKIYDGNGFDGLEQFIAPLCRSERNVACDSTDKSILGWMRNALRLCDNRNTER